MCLPRHSQLLTTFLLNHRGQVFSLFPSCHSMPGTEDQGGRQRRPSPRAGLAKLAPLCLELSVLTGAETTAGTQPQDLHLHVCEPCNTRSLSHTCREYAAISAMKGKGDDRECSEKGRPGESYFTEHPD